MPFKGEPQLELRQVQHLLNLSRDEIPHLNRPPSKQ